MVSGLVTPLCHVICLEPIHHGTFLLSLGGLSGLVPTNPSPHWDHSRDKTCHSRWLNQCGKTSWHLSVGFMPPKTNASQVVVAWHSLVKKRPFDPGVGRPVPKCSQLLSSGALLPSGLCWEKVDLNVMLFSFLTWLLEPRAIIFSAGHWAWSVSPRPPSG